MARHQTADTDTPVLLEIERFEHVSAGAERVLLRVDGRYAERPGKRVLDAMLFVDDGLAVHRHAPLEDGADAADGWLWRAAFDVPASYLVDDRTRFALESDPSGLIDLPRPVELGARAAVPLTERAAHTARRYAAAIAVVLAVAVAPGGLPAHARTEVLRVRNADGSVVYVTADGRTLTELPPDAVIVDDQAPPAPAPEPAPAAPAPEPEPGPAAAPPRMHNGATPTDEQQPERGALSNLAEGARQQQSFGHVASSSSPGRAGHRNSGNDGGARRHGHSGRGSGSGGGNANASAGNGGGANAGATTDGGATTSRAGHPAVHGHGHANAGTPATAPQPTTPQPTTAAAPLETLPTLAVANGDAALETLPTLVAGNDNAQLQPLTRIDSDAVRGTGVLPAPTAAADLPGKGLQPIANLGGPAHGATVAIPDPAATPPLPDAPDLFDPTEDEAQPSSNDPKPPSAHHGSTQHHTRSHHHADPRPRHHGHNGTGGHSAPDHAPDVGGHTGAITTPGAANPNFFDELPGPGNVTGVPNFVIQKFHVPPFLLPIYQAAGIQYGIRWEVLAAINEIETDYGRNLNVSSAGALGWMQFMPATWKMYGVDANKDGKRDPYNPVDAIFAAARYLKAAGGDKDVRQAIFAYNHAGWYVDSVMLRARLIAGYPADLIGSLTGLTEGRFPVASKARYADDLATKLKHVKAGQNAANVVDSDATRRGIDIFAKPGAPVVATNDGVVKEIGRDKKRGRYVVLQDVYGNQFTYSHLGSLAKLYPVPKESHKRSKHETEPVAAHDDPKPRTPASAGTQRPGATTKPAKHDRRGAPRKPPRGRKPVVAAVKERLFAHPTRPVSKRHGGLDQLLEAHGSADGFTTYDNYFSHPLGLNSKNAELKPLKKGSHVIASTVLGHVGGKKRPHIHFEIRPAGKGAPKIDPKPILDGWKLLESTAVYRAKGRNVLYGDGDFSIGEIMLLPKPLLVKRVLSDPRIDIYPQGREDIRTGQVDRRVLVVLEYLAESGLKPTVSCLKSGHSLMTASGNISEHSSGNAVDISAINGVPIAGHQGAGSVTEQSVRRLMLLQGTIRPHQIISLLDFGQNTLALGDHDDHIHVGFHPLFGQNEKLGRQAQSVLKPGQWDDLVQRLGEIDNPNVPTHPSKYAIPDDHE